MPPGYIRGRGFGWLRPEENFHGIMSSSRVRTGMILDRARGRPFGHRWPGRVPTVASSGWPQRAAGRIAVSRVRPRTAMVSARAL